MITTIISGGQTGADQGALAAAREAGLMTGGWIPLKAWTDDGPRLDLITLYNLRETGTPSYAYRTKLNVRDSQGTLIFGNPYSAGCQLTRRYIDTLHRPWYIVHWPVNAITNAKLKEPDLYFGEWLAENNIKVLNVAGNRENKNPGIFDAVKEYLLVNLHHLQQGEQP